MSTVAVLGVVWALVGVPLAVRYMQERRELPREEFQRTMGALQAPNPVAGGLGRRTAGRRRLVSTLTYVPGLVLLAIGIPKSDTSMMAAGLILVNLGTAHRLVAMVVDRTYPRRGPAWAMPALPPTTYPSNPGIDEGPGD